VFAWRNIKNERVTVVILCVYLPVCVSVTTLTATYLVCESKLRCYKIPCGIPNACVVWTLLKRFVLQFWRNFADSRLAMRAEG
jgi:hypothetical protein